MIILNADHMQHKDNPSIPYNETFLFSSPEKGEEVFQNLKINLKFDSTLLKESQTFLNLENERYSFEALEKINPDDIVMQYMEVEGMPSIYVYTLWQSIMEIVVSGYQIGQMEITQTSYTDPTVYFVMENSLNSILLALIVSDDRVYEEIDNMKKTDSVSFILFFAIASFSLFLSMILLVPLLSKVNRSKQEVLELFMHIKKRDANIELNKCRKFLGSFHPNLSGIGVVLHCMILNKNT